MTFPLPPSFPPTTTIFHRATPSTPTTPILFLLPGNPGLISYYDPFLSTLSTQHPTTHIFGASHAGFSPSSDSSPYRYYPLATQISIKLQLLQWLVSGAWDTNDATAGTHAHPIIFLSHSMGSFLVLEMLRALTEMPAPPRVLGAVYLFPTILSIAESPSGVLLSPILNSAVARGTLVAGCRALSWLPKGVLGGVVGAVTGQRGEARDVTVGFLRAPESVRMTLEMAGEEMREFHGVWGRWDGVWAAAARSREEGFLGGARMVFYFGEGDRWVAKKTRTEICGYLKEEKAVSTVVCEEGLPHGFCVGHGERMAEICGRWIREMLDGERLVVV